MHQLFLDYKQAYDSVNRQYLYKTLKELGVPMKIVRLVQMTMAQTVGKVLVSGSTSREFSINRGLRQGDVQ